MKYTRFAFANYRNLARRSQVANNTAMEVHDLNKCLEIHAWYRLHMPAEMASADTIAEIHDRLRTLTEC